MTKITMTNKMNNDEAWPILFDDLLLRSQTQFRKDFLDFLMHRKPGENTWTYLLDSWLGELPTLLLKKDCWHREYEVNESVHARYMVASEVVRDRSEAEYVSLRNLPTQDFLASISDGSAMVMVATDSLWAMTDTQLFDCLKGINRCLHRNGAAFIVGLVRTSLPDFQDLYFDRLRLQLPPIRAVTSILEDRFNSGTRTEESFCYFFSEAGLNAECICKQLPLQAWLLTRSDQKKLFSRY